MSREDLRKKFAAADDSVQRPRAGPIPPEKDRIVRPREAVLITGRSLASQHRDRKAGKWVPIYRIGYNSIGFMLSDLLALNATREIVTPDNTIPVAPGAKRGRKPGNGHHSNERGGLQNED